VADGRAGAGEHAGEREAGAHTRERMQSPWRLHFRLHERHGQGTGSQTTLTLYLLNTLLLPHINVYPWYPVSATSPYLCVGKTPLFTN